MLYKTWSSMQKDIDGVMIVSWGSSPTPWNRNERRNTPREAQVSFS